MNEIEPILANCGFFNSSCVTPAFTCQNDSSESPGPRVRVMQDSVQSPSVTVLPMDNIVLCDISAIEYISYARRHGYAERMLGKWPRVPRRANGSLAMQAPSFACFEEFCENDLRGVSRPLCLLVTDPSLRRCHADVEYRSWSRPIPAKALIEARPGLYVCSPEFALVHAASRLTRAELALLCCELSGTYACGKDDTRYDVGSATSVAAIERMAVACAGARHIEQLRQVLAFVADGAASPREAALFIALCFPRRWGGYGLPAPVFNYSIFPDKRRGGSASWREYRCDLFWPQAKLGVEYLGRKYHMGSEATSRDVIRENNLRDRGVTVIPVTSAQLVNQYPREALVRDIARVLGIRVRPFTHEKAAIHDSLMHELFGRQTWS